MASTPLSLCFRRTMEVDEKSAGCCGVVSHHGPSTYTRKASPAHRRSPAQAESPAIRSSGQLLPDYLKRVSRRYARRQIKRKDLLVVRRVRMSQDGQSHRSAWLKDRAARDSPVSRPACFRRACMYISRVSHRAISRVVERAIRKSDVSTPEDADLGVGACALADCAEQDPEEEGDRSHGQPSRGSCACGHFARRCLSPLAVWVSRWALRHTLPVPLCPFSAPIPRLCPTRIQHHTHTYNTHQFQHNGI